MSVCFAACAFYCLFSPVPARAAAQYTFQKAQSEELSKTVPGGAFVTPWGMAFDASGKLYLAEPGNAAGGIIDTFDTANAFQAQLGASFLSGEYTRGVAVDEESGDVYVADSNNSELFVMSESGEGLSQWSGANTPAGSFGAGCCFVYAAVDNSSSAARGEVYVMSTQGGGEVDVFKPQGENKEEGKFIRQLEVPGGFAFGSEDGIAVDDSSGPTAGDVYVTDSEHKVVDRFNAAGEVEEARQLRGVSESEPFTEPTAVAVDHASGDVFVIDRILTGPVIDEFGPQGEFLGQISEPGAQSAFGHPVGVAVQRAGANAGELYVSDIQAHAVDVFSLEAAAAPSIEGEGVAEVSADAASLLAEIDPHGQLSFYHFEYGACASASSCSASPYEHSTPIPEGTFGSEEDFSVHSLAPVRVRGLSGSTSYHFRVVAHNSHGQAVGQERSFSTQGADAGAGLPDARQWELVSPPTSAAE